VFVISGVPLDVVMRRTLPLLLIIVGSDAVDGIERFPVERSCVVAGVMTVAVVAVAVVLPELDGATVTGATVSVGEGTPSDDCVAVGAPVTTCAGVAVTAEEVVTGAVAAPVPATVAAAVVPVVVPVVATVEAAVVAPPPLITSPVAVSLMTAGVASELMERLTVISGFAASAGFWNCPVG
jgi:hypothetical protein